MIRFRYSGYGNCGRKGCTHRRDSEAERAWHGQHWQGDAFLGDSGSEVRAYVHTYLSSKRARQKLGQGWVSLIRTEGRGMGRYKDP